MTFWRPSSPRRRGLCMIGRYAPAILAVRRSRTIFTECVSPNARIFAPHPHLHPQLNCCRNCLIALSSISDIFSCQHKTERAPPCWPPLPGRFELDIFLNLCDCDDCADFLLYIHPRVSSKDQPGGWKIFDPLCANYVAGLATCRVQIYLYLSCKIYLYLPTG